MKRIYSDAEKKFRKDYTNTLNETVKFLFSMNEFHTVGFFMKAEQALGMPWYYMPGISFKFTQMAGSRKNKTGQILFSQGGRKNAHNAKKFDNLARTFSYALMEVKNFTDLVLQYGLRDPASKIFVQEIDRTYPPAIELQRKLAREEDQRLFDEYDKMISAHDIQTVSGGQAFYKDLRNYIKQAVKQFPMSSAQLAYLDWFDHYISEKEKGRADKDILPLPLNYDFYKHPDNLPDPRF